MKKCILFCLCLVAALHTWAQTSASWQQTNGPEGGYVFNMCRNTSTVYAGTDNGIWASTDEGQSWHVLNAAMNDQRIMALHVAGDEIIAFALKFEDSYGGETAFYRSTNAGQTWTKVITSNAPMYLQFSSYSGPVRLWREGNHIWLINDYSEIYKSDDDGATWNTIAPPASVYFNETAISGNKILGYSTYDRYISEDSGQTWTNTPDSSYVSALYNDGNFVIKLTYDSIFASHDFGQTWTGTTSQFYQLGGIIKRADGTLAMISSQLLLSADGINWQSQTPSGVYYTINMGVESGDGFIAAGGRGIYHSTQNNTLFEESQHDFIGMRISSLAAMSNGRLVTGTTYQGTWSSTNNGLTWDKIPDLNVPYNSYAFQEMTAKGDSIFAIRGDDSLYLLVGNSNTWTKVLDADAWFAGESFIRIFGNEIYLVEDKQIRRSKDGSATWQTIVIDSSTFYGLRDIARSGNFLFFTTNDGHVYRSSDDGVSWQNVYEFWSPGAHRYNKMGVMGNRIFVWSESESFYSDDNGNNWQNLAMDGLPTDSWGDLLDFSPIDMQYYSNIIICTLPYIGVWISFDQGNSWETLNNGLTNLRGRRLAISGSAFFLGTSASGVWQLNANFEVFSGTVYNDLNQNGVKDNGEPPLPNIIVGAEPLGSFASTDAGGAYSLVAATSLDTLHVALPNNYCTALPPSRAANQTGGGYDFGIHFTEGIIDLQLDITNWRLFRPGFDNKLTLTATNVGNEPVTGAWLTMPIPANITVIGSDPFGVITVVNDALRWQTGTIAPFGHESVQVIVTLSANAAIGDFLSFEGFLDVPNDVAPANNDITLRTQIVGSYDPNDKSAPEYITPDALALGEPVEYTIRFENTGNFYAEKVVVSDFLEAKLDPATFRIISSSHPCTWKIKQDGTVVFTFDAIFLQPQETGFVKFAVAADRDLALNESVSNTAEIFFDFNAPIITNTVKTTVQYPLAAHNPTTDQYTIRVAPNPTSGLAIVNMSSAALEQAYQAVIVDNSGKTISMKQITTVTTPLDLTGLAAGTYDVVVMDKKGTVLGRKAVVVAH